MRDLIALNYSCINGAAHSYHCCFSCWNHHPNENLHMGMVGSDKFSKVYKKDLSFFIK